MKTKLVSLLLAGVMATGLLLGCGGDGEEQEEVSENGQKLTTVEILCMNDWSESIKTEDWENYPVSQVVIKDLEEIGIHLELECIDNESFANVVNTRMASGQDLPDLIAYCWQDEQNVLDWAESGLVYSVSELLEKYDEDGSIKAFYDEKAPGAWERTTAEDGNVYWFSYLAGASGHTAVDRETGTEYLKANPRAVSIRQDWVEAVGEEVKEVYTPEELYDILKKMQDEDANGNGVPDEIADFSINSFSYISPAFGLNMSLLCGYFQEENEVFSNFYHENFPAYIEFMQRVYQDGLIDTSTLNSSQSQLVSENRLSLVSGYAEWDFEYSIPDLDENKTFFTPILVDTDGDLSNGFPVYVDSTETMTYCQYFIPKACENPEAVIKLMDYVYTDRYALMNQIGVEGVAYEVDENGNYLKLPAEGDDAVSFTYTSAGLYALPRFILYPEVADRYDASASQYMINKALWCYDFYTEWYPLANQEETTSYSLAIATDEERAIISEKEEQLTTYAQELLADLITGNKSLDDLPEYQKELENLGLKEYIEVMQARRDRVVNAEK